MLSITQGQRLPLASVTSAATFAVNFEIGGALTVDLACFGLDARGKLADERYMVFFNQPQTPCGSVRQAAAQSFTVSPGTLPASIERLVFTAAIDGAGSLRQLGSSGFEIRDGGQSRARCAFSGQTFAEERAIMLVEFYRKGGEWRMASVLQGFNEGLAALVRHFGGEVAEPEPAPAPRLSLDKRVGEAAPQLLSLAKKAQLSLEKAKLTEVRARVGLILDASGSMDGQYKKGRVQEVVNRLLPLAVHFDDDGELDCWAFGEHPQQLNSVNLGNFADFIQTDHGGWKRWKLGSRYNEEPRVIQQAIDFYRRGNDRTPVYILFISDGGVHSANSQRITRLISEAAALPIFWQFVGIGGSNYGILEKLDDMRGRIVDNCNFFALDDLRDISEEALYERLMAEFPDWLQAARAKGIIA